MTPLEHSRAYEKVYLARKAGTRRERCDACGEFVPECSLLADEENERSICEQCDRERTFRVKPEIVYGHPLVTFKFTGEYSQQEVGGSRAKRKNKRTVWSPIYRHGEDGSFFIDMTQAFRKEPQREASGSLK